MKTVRMLCVMAGMAILSGCSLSPIKTAPLSTYTMSNWPKKTTMTSNKTVSRQTLLISTPMASPGYNSSRMIYVTIPYQLRAFADNRWVSSPAQLLLPLIANRMRATHYFHAVVTAPFSGTVNYQLNTQLLTLQQEFLQPESDIRLVIESTLVKVTTGQVISSRVFEAVVPAHGNDPYDGVVATNKAVHIVLNRVAQFVSKAVKFPKSARN